MTGQVAIRWGVLREAPLGANDLQPVDDMSHPLDLANLLSLKEFLVLACH